MENMHDILERLNTLSGSQILREGRAVKEDDVEEGNRFTGELAKARAAGKKEADLDGDGDMEPVKEAKMPDANKDGIPDYAQDGKGAKDLGKGKTAKLDKSMAGTKKSMSAKQAKYFGGRKSGIKESLHVIHEINANGVRATIRHDREYDEYEVCVETDQGVRRAFVNDAGSAHRLLENLMAERQAKSKSKDKPFFPSPDADDEKTAFRKKFAPSVMQDPKAKGEVEKLDRDLERLKKMRRGELDPDDTGDEPAAGEKRGRGRPKKYTADRPRQERVTAKARKADRTTWTPDRKKKKVTEQGVAEERMDESHYEVGDKVICKQSGMPGEIIKLDKPHGASDEKYYTFRREDGKIMKKSAADLRSAANEDYDRDEYDEEGEMAQSQSRTIEDAAQELQAILDTDENLPEWVQKKITLAMDYIDTARDYLKSNRPGDDNEEMSLPEGSTGDYSAKKARAGKDIGKPGKQFSKIAADAAKRYGSKERGEKVAGAVLAKLRKEGVGEARNPQALDYQQGPEDDEEYRRHHGLDDTDRQRERKLRATDHKTLDRLERQAVDRAKQTDMEESALQAHIGKKKYGKEGMAALQRAGREGAGKDKMARIRAQHDKLDEVDLEEKAVSRAQRAAAGIARAAQKGEIPRSELRGASKEMSKMEPKELRKFAKTKEKGLPEKKKEEPVKETTTAGSVATAPESGEKKSKGGIQFGKGVYEARLAEQFEREMESIMTESLDVAITANADGSNTVTVTGKDVAPDMLQDLLQMAGMSGSREPVYQPVQAAAPGGDDMAGMLDALDGIAGSAPDQDLDMMSEPSADAEIMPEDTVCEVCGGHEGMHEAGCDREMALEADLGNSADHTETMSSDYMVDELAGGLNGPKLHSNPNNPGDNPLAMRPLGRTASPNLNLGAIAEEIERETENRLLALYRSVR